MGGLSSWGGRERGRKKKRVTESRWEGGFGLESLAWGLPRAEQRQQLAKSL